MRMRFKPYARPELAAWERHIENPDSRCGRWGEVFARPELPLRVELGCGKGGFLAGLALREPACNYLGVDIKSEMLVVAKRTIEREFMEAGRATDNVAICNWNIERIGALLDKRDRVERVYINFCNPWYKSGHAKHRLTHPRQLAQLRDFLADGGEVWFKTDDGPLFEDSLRYFEYTGFAVRWLCRDLHREEPAWNQRTEHEEMFAQQGMAIKACIAVMQEATLDRAAIARLKNL